MKAGDRLGLVSGRRIASVVSLALAFLLAAGVASGEAIRGLKVVAIDKSSGAKKEVPLYGKSYAVIIGIDQYENLKFDQQLSYAVRDAKGVEESLRKNFKFDRIITLYNKDAKKDNILKVLAGDLSSISEDDSVFVFWAGHGHTEKTTYGDLGYLIPFDGTFNSSELYKNISMTTLKDDISKRIPAKHVFYVMDACYSGLLATTRGAERKSARDLEYLQQVTREKVRQVLTAGDKDQQVLDGGPRGHSVFTGRFIEILDSAEDFITATEVSSLLKERVFSDARARNHIQTPKSGELFGLGDYVFIPSIERKAEDTQAKLAGYQKDLEKIRELEKAALAASDERAMRQVEIEKKAALAKLKAEQLRQQGIEEERRKREQEEHDRVAREQELARRKSADDARLAALKQEVAEKRKAMGGVTLSSLSPETTLGEMLAVDAKIKEIKESFRKELADGIRQIAERINAKFVKIGNAKKDEFESEAEFKSRVAREKAEAGSEQTTEFSVLEKRIEDEYRKQVEPFIESLKKLSGTEFALASNDLDLELGTYDGVTDTYPVTIRAKKPIKGIQVAVNGNIPIPREEARIFKQHYENRMLRPEMTGNFQSTGLFRVSKAFVIDDSTNKQYDIFSSKFVLISENIVYDSVTKLLWDRNPVFPGKAGKKSSGLEWDDSVRRCAQLEIDGLKGWRLPSTNELKRMVTLKQEPMEPNPFGETWPYNWTYEEDDRGKILAVVLKQNKIEKEYRKSESGCWCVRGDAKVNILPESKNVNNSSTKSKTKTKKAR